MGDEDGLGLGLFSPAGKEAGVGDASDAAGGSGVEHVVAPGAVDVLGAAVEEVFFAGGVVNDGVGLVAVQVVEEAVVVGFEVDTVVGGGGADAVVLAGTDLNLAFDGQVTDYRVIDALDVHVQLLADLATGRKLLS